MPKSDYTRTEKTLKIINILFNHPSGVNIGTIINDLDCSKENALELTRQIQFFLPNAVEMVGRGAERALKLKKSPLSLALDLKAYQETLEVPSLLTRVALGLNDHIVDPETVDFMDHILGLNHKSQFKSRVFPKVVNFSRGYVDYHPFKDRLKVFTKAIATKTVCELIYARNSLEPGALLRFTPLEIIGYHGKIYIAGRRVKVLKNSLIDQGQRILALQRTREVKLMDRSFPASFGDLMASREEMFGLIATDPFILEANFAPRLLGYLEENVWPGLIDLRIIKGRNLKDRPSPFKNWVKMRIKCGDQYETLSWLRGFGSEAVIISPKSLKDLYREDLIQLTKSFKGLRATRVAVGPKTLKKVNGWS
ncbi:MAG: WYL domain-containing protein [Deltaproteobacteria bacterium]|jgi:hypothetical protein|nr:WYL domain-containing protein [Deltaproteobacteria bacterium]